jgi:hypothetical protein
LQNFNTRISALALAYIVLSSIFAEPIMNYYLAKALSEAHYETDDGGNLTDMDESSQPSTFGCLKSCLLNLHVFTLQTWLVRNQTVGRLAMHGRMSHIITENFEKLDESFENQ